MAVAVAPLALGHPRGPAHGGREELWGPPGLLLPLLEKEVVVRGGGVEVSSGAPSAPITVVVVAGGIVIIPCGSNVLRSRCAMAPWPRARVRFASPYTEGAPELRGEETTVGVRIVGGRSGGAKCKVVSEGGWMCGLARVINRSVVELLLLLLLPVLVLLVCIKEASHCVPVGGLQSSI